MLEKLLNEVANEAVVKIVNKTTYSNLDIPLPPLEEQKRIVSKLDTLFEKIDKAISLHQKNIDEANVFMASVLNDVFVELEEKYGLIEVGKVTDCIVPQRNKPKQFIGNIPWITTDDLKLFKRISQSTKGLGLRREDIEEVKSKTFPKESVLMSCVGDLGIVAIADDEIVVNQQLHTYQCNDNLINTFLMYALFVKKDFMYKIANITTVAYMNKSKCNSIPISIPPLQTQQKVVAYLDEISQKLEKIKQLQKEKMAHLKALKASILDRAFRGEL
jgi:type I restriction enzyme S subunit